MSSSPPQGSTTLAAPVESRVEEAAAVPGAILIFANRRPRCRIFRWEGSPLELGREELAEDDVQDPLISRKHVRLSFDGSAWRVSDLGSRNGTFVGAAPISTETVVASGRLIRVGGALLLPVANTLDFRRYGLGVRDGIVGGPSFRRALETVALSRKSELIQSLLLSGESGTGKEVAARRFHDSGPNPNAAFVAVNCATIPKDIAERLLFGSRRGAYSGAIDALGHVQMADGGTLFLDEVAELPPEVQTKLLRVLETREVQRLGATSYERVEVRVCAATWRDLRQDVARGQFREDLYFRIGQPEIKLPPLRERVEEIPWHVHHLLADLGSSRQLEATSAFIEACAMRPWPGNVRELRAEVRRAAVLSSQDGRPLTADELAPTAGTPIGAERAPGVSVAFPSDEISTALAAERGNVVKAARRLGIDRSRIRRWLERHGIEARQFKGANKG